MNDLDLYRPTRRAGLTSLTTSQEAVRFTIRTLYIAVAGVKLCGEPPLTRQLHEFIPLTHHDKLKAWKPEDPDTRRLQYLISDRRAVVDERTEFTNRLQDLLKQYFPQSLELCGNELCRPLATSFLLKWPTLQLVKRARPATLR